MIASTLSTMRRQVLRLALPVFAALAAAAAAPTAAECVPKTANAFAPPTVAEISTKAAGDKLVVTGRVVGSDCRPLAGALVELWNAESKIGSSAKTGADGRFTVTTVAVRGPIQLRITHNGRTIST